jgi:hypothetical protein
MQGNKHRLLYIGQYKTFKKVKAVPLHAMEALGGGEEV